MTLKIQFSSATIVDDNSIYVFGETDVQVANNCYKPQSSGRDVIMIKVDSQLNMVGCYVIGNLLLLRNNSEALLLTNSIPTELSIPQEKSFMPMEYEPK